MTTKGHDITAWSTGGVRIDGTDYPDATLTASVAEGARTYVEVRFPINTIEPVFTEKPPARHRINAARGRLDIDGHTIRGELLDVAEEDVAGFGGLARKYAILRVPVAAVSQDFTGGAQR